MVNYHNFHVYLICRQKTSSKDLKCERPDVYLIPKEPGRSGPPAKISERTNIHILVEFGLQVLKLFDL